jgi:hypothetical protein
MNVAVFSESLADEAAVQILVESILGEQIQPVSLPLLRTRGWPSISYDLPMVLKHLHYRTNAQGLVVVVDSDESPVHLSTHEQLGGADTQCRTCQLRGVVIQVQNQLRPIINRAPIKTAIGIAVPAIEAWYRCELDPHVMEAAWIQALQSGNYPYTKRSLKQDVYGAVRTPKMNRAVEEARRLAQNLAELETWFPNGFGALARDVRGW